MRTTQDIYGDVIKANQKRILKNMNQTKTDTPETDAIITRLLRQTGHVGQHNCPEEWVLHARKLERERDELLAHFAKCHEAIGESPDSEKSELWKYFENFQSIIARLRVADERNARMLERERDKAKFDADDESRWATSYKAERDEARRIIADALKALPVGYIPSHTPDSLPERIADLVSAIVAAERDRDESLPESSSQPEA